jgi:hypothetical protein
VDRFLRAGHFGEGIEPRIGHRHNRFVRLDGAERIVCALSVLFARQRVENGGFPDVWKPDDAYTQTHDNSL